MFTPRTRRALLKALITKRSPLYVQFAVTKRCNLSCRMCASNESRSGEEELSLDQIKILADRLDAIKCGIILLTGGEPFLRADLPEIIRIFTQKGFTVRVQTNGLAATDVAIAAACAAGLREITISLDSLDPALQDDLTGRAGSWDEIMQALARFSRHLPCKGTMVGVNTVVCRKNITEIPRLIQFVTQLGFYSSLIPIHLANADDDAYIIRKNVPDLAFTPLDHAAIDQVYATVRAMKKNGAHIYNSDKFLRLTPDFLKGNRINWHCDSPDLYFAISPSGKFLPCVDLVTDYSMLDEDFVARFHSQSFRDEIHRTVRNCKGCFYACWPEMTFLCRDRQVFLERVRLALRAGRISRTMMTYDACVALAKKL